MDADVNDLLDISDRVLPVSVLTAGMTVAAYTDGQHYYFDDAGAAEVGAHLTGGFDLAGRAVRVECDNSGSQEHRGRSIRRLHQRHIGGRTVFRFDSERLFTVVTPRPAPLRSR